MKALLIIFLIKLASLGAQAAPALEVGDILLQPLNCWSCSLIEAEDDTQYSHMGLVLKDGDTVKIAESFGTVKLTSPQDFIAKTEPGQRLLLIRMKDKKARDYLEQNKAQLLELFHQNYENKQYDEAFLWDNIDENGVEKLYCSEFISKLLSTFLQIPFPIKQMHFQRNRQHWINYFKGNVPDGKWGNSPADFENSNMYMKVGEL